MKVASPHREIGVPLVATITRPWAPLGSAGGLSRGRGCLSFLLVHDLAMQKNLTSSSYQVLDKSVHLLQIWFAGSRNVGRHRLASPGTVERAREVDGTRCEAQGLITQWKEVTWPFWFENLRQVA